ncbi:hypothetical protein [Streptomyces sp. gCLA4]|uniref:hypothetical protein n=1 Tax=Streptomyces sp. gCLA4 TaxID=1873416 RepID=UPI0016003BE3|nr:hypothetical protein [Streptomyces sp. gCLA4]
MAGKGGETLAYRAERPIRGRYDQMTTFYYVITLDGRYLDKGFKSPGAVTTWVRQNVEILAVQQDASQDCVTMSVISREEIPAPEFKLPSDYTMSAIRKDANAYGFAVTVWVTGATRPGDSRWVWAAATVPGPVSAPEGATGEPVMTVLAESYLVSMIPVVEAQRAEEQRAEEENSAPVTVEWSQKSSGHGEHHWIVKASWRGMKFMVVADEKNRFFITRNVEANPFKVKECDRRVGKKYESLFSRESVEAVIVAHVEGRRAAHIKANAAIRKAATMPKPEWVSTLFPKQRKQSALTPEKVLAEWGDMVTFETVEEQPEPVPVEPVADGGAGAVMTPKERTAHVLGLPPLGRGKPAGATVKAGDGSGRWLCLGREFGISKNTSRTEDFWGERLPFVVHDMGSDQSPAPFLGEARSEAEAKRMIRLYVVELGLDQVAAEPKAKQTAKAKKSKNPWARAVVPTQYAANGKLGVYGRSDRACDRCGVDGETVVMVWKWHGTSETSGHMGALCLGCVNTVTGLVRSEALATAEELDAERGHRIDLGALRADEYQVTSAWTGENETTHVHLPTGKRYRSSRESESGYRGAVLRDLQGRSHGAACSVGGLLVARAAEGRTAESHPDRNGDDWMFFTYGQALKNIVKESFGPEESCTPEERVKGEDGFTTGPLWTLITGAVAFLVELVYVVGFKGEDGHQLKVSHEGTDALFVTWGEVLTWARERAGVDVADLPKVARYNRARVPGSKGLWSVYVTGHSDGGNELCKVEENHDEEVYGAWVAHGEGDVEGYGATWEDAAEEYERQQAKATADTNRYGPYERGQIVRVDGEKGMWCLMAHAQNHGVWQAEPATWHGGERREFHLSALTPVEWPKETEKWAMPVDAKGVPLRLGMLAVQNFPEQTHASPVLRIYENGSWLADVARPDGSIMKEQTCRLRIVTPEQVEALAERLPVEGNGHRGWIVQALVSNWAGKFRATCVCADGFELIEPGHSRKIAWFDTQEEAVTFWEQHAAAERYVEADDQGDAYDEDGEEWDAEETPDVSPGYAVQEVRPGGGNPNIDGTWWAHCNGGREGCYEFGHIIGRGGRGPGDTASETREAAEALGQWHIDGEQGPAPVDRSGALAVLPEGVDVVWTYDAYWYAYEVRCACGHVEELRADLGAAKNRQANREALRGKAIAAALSHVCEDAPATEQPVEANMAEESVDSSPAGGQRVEGDIAEASAGQYVPRPRAQRWEIRRAKEVLTAAGFNDHDQDSTSGTGFVVINDPSHAVNVIPVINGDHRRPRKLADRKLWDENLEEFAEALREAGFTDVGANLHRVRGFAPVPAEAQTVARVRKVLDTAKGYHLREVTFDGYPDIPSRIGFHGAGAGASFYHLQDCLGDAVPSDKGETLTESVERLCDWYGLPEPFSVVYEERDAEESPAGDPWDPDNHVVSVRPMAKTDAGPRTDVYGYVGECSCGGGTWYPQKKDTRAVMANHKDGHAELPTSWPMGSTGYVSDPDQGTTIKETPENSPASPDHADIAPAEPSAEALADERHEFWHKGRNRCNHGYPCGRDFINNYETPEQQAAREMLELKARDILPKLGWSASMADAVEWAAAGDLYADGKKFRLTRGRPVRADRVRLLAGAGFLTLPKEDGGQVTITTDGTTALSYAKAWPAGLLTNAQADEAIKRAQRLEAHGKGDRWSRNGLSVLPMGETQKLAEAKWWDRNDPRGKVKPLEERYRPAVTVNIPAPDSSPAGVAPAVIPSPGKFVRVDGKAATVRSVDGIATPRTARVAWADGNGTKVVTWEEIDHNPAIPAAEEQHQEKPELVICGTPVTLAVPSRPAALELPAVPLCEALEAYQVPDVPELTICGPDAFMPMVPRSLATIEKQVRTEMAHRTTEQQRKAVWKVAGEHKQEVRRSQREALPQPEAPAVLDGETIEPMNPGWGQAWWMFADVYGYGFEVQERRGRWHGMVRLDEWQIDKGVSIPGKLVTIPGGGFDTAAELLDACRQIGQQRAVQDAGGRMVRRVLDQQSEPVPAPVICTADLTPAMPQPKPVDPRLEWLDYQRPEPVDPRVSWAQWERELAEPEPVDVLAELRAELAAERREAERWQRELDAVLGEVGGLVVAEAMQVVQQAERELAEMDQAESSVLARMAREAMGVPIVRPLTVPRRTRRTWALAASVVGFLAAGASMADGVIPPRV